VIKFTLNGIAVQQSKFKEFPSFLAARAQAALISKATTVAAAIQAAYPVVDGTLAAGMSVRSQPRKTKARVVIHNRARYALIYDIGWRTPRRTKKTKANRGSMPAKPTFIPRVMQAREDLVPVLAAIMRAEGLTVSGG
jgi:hypothetical protein